jgi:hypothetical protein
MRSLARSFCHPGFALRDFILVTALQVHQLPYLAGAFLAVALPLELFCAFLVH